MKRHQLAPPGDRPTVPNADVMPVCVTGSDRGSPCANCDAVRAYCDRVDAYLVEVAAWSESNPDDMEPPVPFDAPWCPRSV